MDPVRLRVHGRHQGVGIGALQLGQLAPVQDGAGQGVVLGQVLQHAGVGAPLAAGGLLAAGQVHLAEQDLADLSGTADVEGAPGQLVRLLLQLGHALAESRGQGAQPVRIDPHPGPLHVGQDGGHAALQRLIDIRQALGRQARLQQAMQAQGHVRILGGVADG